MPPKEVIPGEYYRVGMRMRLYLVEVDRGPMGIQTFCFKVSSCNACAKLFELEVPEIGSGVFGD